ncbi:Rieske 2Fe-2S domain-containing protein [Streptomyces sp. 71268]|uniref:Rieske 2Fe-2S domain-containing protein n=1 Tax=Streptomyces sp. 71268 TaxID=3002640 RepID=UPI0023F75810|nr:Rieske 2Fe-2S domain-containing protein [Streptomyces sp. 71268]WEV26093.1 Rieske 2Fe-2S domain-containing protein [Streptomyces sp. 71268]
MQGWSTRRRDARLRRLGPSRAERTARLPYPDGWFGLATSREVGRGAVVTRRLMGDDVVLYRTRGGRLRAVRPFCPHLGAHLGHGGAVRGENIVCPFHHFEFAPDGACVATGYGSSPPPKARLGTLHVREVDDLIYVWRHAQGQPPSWEIEPWPLDAAYPTPYGKRHLLRDHPQDVVENIVDFGHLTPIHGTVGEVLSEPRFEAERLRTSFRILPAGGDTAAWVSAAAPELTVRVQGLGIVYTSVEVPKIGCHIRTVLTATPVSPTHVEVYVSGTMWFDRLGRGRAAGALTSALSRPLAWVGSFDFGKDFPVWAHKTYLERPRLAKGDGPIMNYRRWARQFYSEPLGADVAEEAG